MIQTLIALLFAHILADFLLQTRWMVAHKQNIGVLLGHITIVAALSYAALGFTGHWVVLAVAGSHLLFDAVKTYWPGKSFRAFWVDQALHIAVIVIAATQFPTLYSTGVWQEYGLLDTAPTWLVRIPDSWVAQLPLAMLLSAGPLGCLCSGLRLRRLKGCRRLARLSAIWSGRWRFYLSFPASRKTLGFCWRPNRFCALGWLKKTAR